MEKWQKLLSNAIKHKVKSEALLDASVKELMKTKGFTEEQCLLFGACFAGGQETIVSFNSDGEDNDFGLENYCGMTKEEIIKYLSKFLMKENIKLLMK